MIYNPVEIRFGLNYIRACEEETFLTKDGSAVEREAQSALTSVYSENDCRYLGN